MRDEPPATPRAAGLSGVRPTEAASAPIAFPSWNRSWPVRLVRRLSLPTWILPVIGRYLDLSVTGAAHLDGLRQPVLFASNHQSHLDTPAILLALPRRLRYRVAPAMAKEYFAAHFGRANAGWRTRLANSASYYLACAFFNAFPLPQREAGARQTVRYIGTVLAGGDSVLIFPEGRRTSTEAIGRFLPGVGMLGSRLQVPVIPVRVEGLDRVMPAGSLRPRRGPVRVAFGAPISLEGQDYAAMALRVESAVRGLDATEN